MRTQTRSEDRFGRDRRHKPRWNAAPTSKLPVVVSRNGERTLTLMRWGLVPSWADDSKIGHATFNARAEGIDTRPAFRAAWKSGRRCLVIADGYYEWRDCRQATLRCGARQSRPDDLCRPVGPVARAGRRSRSNPSPSSPPPPMTCSHPCMPACRSCSAPDRWAGWLGENAATDAELKAMLKPYPGAAMTFWPVDRRVGNVRNDDPGSVRAAGPGRSRGRRTFNQTTAKYFRHLIIIPSYRGVARLSRCPISSELPAECRVFPHWHRGRGTMGDPRHRVTAEHVGICCSSSFRRNRGENE